jgi:hypothetical protein
MRSIPAVLCVALLALGACAARFEVDGERMHRRVQEQVGLGPRIPGTAGHAAMRAWLEQQLAPTGGRLEWQRFPDSTLGRRLEVNNLIARFGPGHGRRIMLCAHYDSRPWCDQDPDSSHRDDPVPGANDGGSGVAVLLEVAELMHRRAPPIGVDLVFFDAEDMGRPERPEEFSIGARGYAARLPERDTEARPVAAFLFDMVGDRDLQIYPEVNSARRAANLVGLVLEAAGQTRARSFHPEPRYNLTDDHTPLLEAGLPTVDIIDFDYPAWHTHRDLPDQVSAASLAEVAGVAAWLVYKSPLARP